MTSFERTLVEVAAQSLERDEREAVLGDLAEAGEGPWRGIFEILGLSWRRQAMLWKNWRPWLASFGLALPSSFLLMGASVSISATIARGTWLTAHRGFPQLVCQVILLLAWSWTGGFVVGSVSRRTLWVSAALCLSPCLFCLARFRMESLSWPCLFLFLPPAIAGVCHGLRTIRIKLGSTILLAAVETALMLSPWSSRGPWVFNCLLIWPVWFLVVTTGKSPCEAARRW